MRTPNRPAKTKPPAEPAEDAPAGGIGAWLAAALVHVLFGFVALMGLLTLQAGIRVLFFTHEHHWGSALMVTAMGLIFSIVGLGYFYLGYIKAPIWAARERAIEARYPGQPWMQRADWAARRVTDSSLGTMMFLWVWVVGWWGAILFIWTMNRDKILAAAAESWGQAALGLIFPLGGLLGLLIAVQVTRTWLRYGRTALRIDTLPGRLGDQFRGTLEVNFRERPAALEAELLCERVTWRTRRSGGKTSRERMTETVWSETHPIEPSRIMLQGRGGGATLALSVPLPADQPPCGLDADGDGIQWRLEVREVTPAGASAGGSVGPGFSASFEVPVFGR